MRGSALVTTVLDSIATNIASSRPLRASRTSRCVIGAGWVLGKEELTPYRRLTTATIFPGRARRPIRGSFDIWSGVRKRGTDDCTDPDPGLPAGRPRDRATRPAHAPRGRGRHRGRRRGGPGRRRDPRDPAAPPRRRDPRRPPARRLRHRGVPRGARRRRLDQGPDPDQLRRRRGDVHRDPRGRGRLRPQADRRYVAAQRHPRRRPGPLADRPVGGRPRDRPDAQRPVRRARPSSRH